MPATKGRRNPALLATKPTDDKTPGVEYAYLVGRRPLTVNGNKLQPGEEIPDAEARIPRMETWMASGAVRRVRRDELETPKAADKPPAPAAEDNDGDSS